MLRSLVISAAAALALAAPAVAPAAQPVANCGPVTVLWADSLPDRMAGYASGLRIDPGTDSVRGTADDPWTLERCEITLARNTWLTLTRYQQCVLIRHESEHLNLRRHEPTGVMAQHIEDADDPTCDGFRTLRQRVIDDLSRRHHADSLISCSRWQGRVLPCTVELPSGRIVRYRVRTRTGSSSYAVSRVRRAAR